MSECALGWSDKEGGYLLHLIVVAAGIARSQPSALVARVDAVITRTARLLLTIFALGGKDGAVLALGTLGALGGRLGLGLLGLRRRGLRFR